MSEGISSRMPVKDFIEEQGIEVDYNKFSQSIDKKFASIVQEGTKIDLGVASRVDYFAESLDNVTWHYPATIDWGNGIKFVGEYVLGAFDKNSDTTDYDVFIELTFWLTFEGEFVYNGKKDKQVIFSKLEKIADNFDNRMKMKALFNIVDMDEIYISAKVEHFNMVYAVNKNLQWGTTGETQKQVIIALEEWVYENTSYIEEAVRRVVGIL